MDINYINNSGYNKPRLHMVIKISLHGNRISMKQELNNFTEFISVLKTLKFN